MTCPFQLHISLTVVIGFDEQFNSRLLNATRLNRLFGVFSHICCNKKYKTQL